MTTARSSRTRSAAVLALFALLVSSCSTPLPQPRPVQPVQVPPPPSELMEPPPSGKWSESVLGWFKRWSQMLKPSQPS